MFNCQPEVSSWQFVVSIQRRKNFVPFCLRGKLGFREKPHLDKVNKLHIMVWNGSKFGIVTKQKGKTMEVK
jgi:hypothetical protein